MYGIGAVVGTLVGTALGQGAGRRAALMMLCLPDILAWVIAALANNILMIKVMRRDNEFWIMKINVHITMFQTSRFLAGLAAGGYSLCIQARVSEL